jgi:ubiquinone/menaquinone biosynthesis C-methylase UbiE
MSARSYRLSHLAPEKGQSYENSFVNLPYRKMVWRWEQEVLTRLIKKLFDASSEIRYLDFACGTGRILSLLESYAAESYGVDISESMLEVARKKCRHATLVHVDLTTTKVFPNQSFDLITAFRFFLNAEQELRESALKEIRYLIKPSGYFIFNIHMNEGSLLVKLIRLYQWIKHIDNDLFHTLSISQASDLLDKHGFTIAEAYHFGVLPIYDERNKYLIGLINSTERIFSKISLLTPFSRYVIFVCRPSQITRVG